MRRFLPFFARRGITSPFGKLMDLGHVRVPTETGQVLVAAAAQNRQPVAEYVREVLVMAAHGRGEMERQHIIRLDGLELVGRIRDGIEPPKD